MGSRGPTKASITPLHGSREPRRRPRPWPFKAELPEPPRWLAGAALEHYRELGALLRGEGLMCRAYFAPFCLLCSAYGHTRQLEALLAAEPAESKQTAALLKLWDKAAARYMSLASQFGCTPNARARVQDARDPPAGASSWSQFSEPA